MHTPESRKEALEKIVRICKDVNDIEGIILVGSGGDQFPDQWADIDLSIVVDPATETRNVWDTLNEKLKGSFEVLTLGLTEYGENNYLTILLLKDYLEIDVGFISLDNLKAKKENWRILYEKKDKVLEKMRQSWDKRSKSDVVEYIRDKVSVIGHYIRTFAVAVNRNQPFKATKELEDMRNIVVGMWATHKGRVAKHFRDVDIADLNFRRKLASTFPKSINLDDLKMAFYNTFDLFFDLAEGADSGNQDIIFVREEMNKLLQNFNLLR